MVDWLFDWLGLFNLTLELSFGLTNVFFDELEIFNVSDKCISVLVSIVENLLGSSAWNGDFQEFPGVVTEDFKLLDGHFSVGSFGHFSCSMHELETHFGAMSLEKKVTLS